MDNPIRRVQWFEGMLLEPQHFQQQERYHHQKSLIYQSAITPFFWGICRLEIDENLLTSGTFLIKNLLAIMQDGSVLHVNEKEDSKPQVILSDQKNIDWSTPQVIHLCIVKHRDDSANMYSDFPRYESVEESDFLDENTGKSPISIPRLKHKITLIVGDKVPYRYISFPIAVIEKRDSNYIKKPFSPACQIVKKNSLLYEETSKIISLIRKKLNFLSSKIQTSNIEDSNSVFQALIRYSNILSPLVPRSEVMLDAEGSHPYEIYKELCFIVGSLANLRRDIVCPRLPTYSHISPLTCYRKVIHLIEDYLSIIQQFSTEIPFAYDPAESTYALDLKHDWQWQDQWVISLYYPIDNESSAAIEWAKNAIITTQENLEEVREIRILGAKRKITNSIPDLALPAKQNVIYLLIEQDDKFINPNGKLIIYNTPSSKQFPFQPRTITLQAIISEETNTKSDSEKAVE
jgi:type VI secretion system protein ImpJ